MQGFTFIWFALLIANCCIRGDQSDGTLPFAIEGLENLLITEHFLIENLNNYANELEERVAKIDRAVRDMRNENEAEKDFNNPFYEFKVIRRLHMDWIYWVSFMEEPFQEEIIDNMEAAHNLVLPSKKDLCTAVSGIHRLKSTYGLNVIDMTRGLLNGKQYNTSLTALDCAIIASQLCKELKRKKSIAYIRENCEEVLPWIDASIEMYEKNKLNDILGLEMVKLLQIKAEILVKCGFAKSARQVISKALEDDPNNNELLKLEIEIVMLPEEFDKTMEVEGPVNRG